MQISCRGHYVKVKRKDAKFRKGRKRIREFFFVIVSKEIKEDKFIVQALRTLRNLGVLCVKLFYIKKAHDVKIKRKGAKFSKGRKRIRDSFFVIVSEEIKEDKFIVQALRTLRDLRVLCVKSFYIKKVPSVKNKRKGVKLHKGGKKRKPP